MDEINTGLAAFCIKDQHRTHSVHREVIAERFARELVALRPLPNPLLRACVTHPVHVNKFSEITVDTNRYGVPTKYAHRSAFVEIYDSRLRVVVDDNVVAELPRAVFVSKQVYGMPYIQVHLVTSRYGGRCCYRSPRSSRHGL